MWNIRNLETSNVNQNTPKEGGSNQEDNEGIKVRKKEISKDHKNESASQSHHINGLLS
jgi:hypothetical protein